VRSGYNVGSLLRSGDGAGVDHVYLCGVTPPASHPQVAKTALGAQDALPTSHHRNSLDLADALLAQGQQLWALETGPTARDLFQSQPAANLALTLVVGSETAGIDPELLARCHQVVALPMLGHKRSLNVASAAAIALYVIRDGG
jgi:tRNA G18 (ribose-2'-O)-methylase SpoU